MNRRNFLRGASVTPLVALGACSREAWVDTSAIESESAQAATALPDTGLPTAAVSLAALREQIRRSAERPSILPGLNRVTGFIAEADDVVLYGHNDASFPALVELDSLAAGLRNAYGAGPDYAGIPGCSIDPIPGEDPFKILKVATFGAPAVAMIARFASLDYELKRAGASIPDEDGRRLFPGAFEIMDRLGPCAGAGEWPVSITHRFWFFPLISEGSRYEQDGASARIIRATGVQLLTEQEFLTRRGERTAATEATPSAKEFATSVTAVLAACKVPRFAQMVSDFRILEVAKLLHFCGVGVPALSYWLNDHGIHLHEIPSVVGGVLREEQGRTVCNTMIRQTLAEMRYEVTVSNYRREYRGGVEARIEVEESDVARTPMEAIRRRVLAARPSPHAVSWDV